MNWFTKQVQLARRSVARARCLYHYLHDLAVLLYRAQAAGGKLPDPARVINLETLDKNQNAFWAEINRAGSRLHAIENTLASLPSGRTTDDEIKDTLFKSIEYCFVSATPGSFAEFGTYEAVTSASIAKAFKAHQHRYGYMDSQHQIAPRKLYFFDSFKGFPEIKHRIDASAPHVAAKAWGKGACRGLSVSQFNEVLASILPSSLFETVPGFYKDTLPQFDPDVRFAFIHVDCDLYESTIDALDLLLARNQVAAGCMILFDDWNCNHASLAHGERKAWQQLAQEHSIQFSDLGSYGCVGQRFIVHSYTPRTQTRPDSFLHTAPSVPAQNLPAAFLPN